MLLSLFFFFNDTATTEIYTLSLHDALPILVARGVLRAARPALRVAERAPEAGIAGVELRGAAVRARRVGVARLVEVYGAEVRPCGRGGPERQRALERGHRA